MNSGEIDRIPVSQLPARYNLVRSAVYTRMDALAIKPEKVGNKAYIRAHDLKLMDELHEFVQRGGTNAEFREMRGLGKLAERPPEVSGGLSTVQPELIQLVAAIASEMAARLPAPTSEPDPFQYFRDLEEACQNGWLLSTSEVAYLLDLLPSTIEQYGDSFSEAGFTFTREGYRVGGEIAWRLSKRLK